jgi:hypothetical protein
MLLSKNSTVAIAVVLMLLNASCSSDSSTDDTQGSEEGVQTGDTTDTTDNGSEPDTADPDNSQTGTAGVFGPPQFNIADCNSLEVSEAQAVNDVSLPTTILTEQLVQGQLSEDSNVLSSDVWQINLQPGNYHLVVDSWMASRELGYHGVVVSSLGETTDDDERLLSTAAQGFDERAYEYLEILNPTTMTIKVEPSYSDTMNYVMGIFPNGVSVPSPRFIDCPSTIRASLDTTTSVTLNDLVSTEDYRWIQLNLSAGVYTLDTSMQSSESYTGYSVELMQRFGEDESERVASEADPGTSVTSSDQFTALDDGEIWLRIANSYNNSGNIELTVSH